MKKRMWIAAVIVLVIVLVAGACIYGYVTGRTDSPDTPDSSAVQEPPARPDAAKPEKPEPGSGNAAQPETPSQPDTSSQTGGESVVVYVPDEQAETLTPVGVNAQDDTDQALADALVAAGSLPEGTAVRSASVTDGVLQLDMNAVYGDAVRTSGTAGETMLIYSLVNTFAQAHGVEKVLITVDGEPLESGHEVYDYPLEMGHMQ